MVNNCFVCADAVGGMHAQSFGALTDNDARRSVERLNLGGPCTSWEFVANTTEVRGRPGVVTGTRICLLATERVRAHYFACPPLPIVHAVCY